MSVRDDYSFLTTYMEYGEEDEEEVDWDSVPSSHLYPEDVDWEDFDYDGRRVYQNRTLRIRSTQDQERDLYHSP